jgi:hypothetical protein
MSEHNTEKKDIVFAIFLIFIGGVFLLNTTGIIGWGVWQYILRFWPVFLILGGVRLILGESLITNIILSVFALILFILVGIYSYTSYSSKTIPFVPSRINEFIFENPDWLENRSGEEIEEDLIVKSEEYEGIESRVLNIDIGASEFFLDDEGKDDEYISLSSIYTKGYIEPSFESEAKDKELTMTFKTIAPQTFGFWGSNSTEFDLSLGNTDLATDINIVLGAGKGEIDLNSLSIGKLNTEVGAGKLSITLDEEAIPTDLSIDLGAGSMVLNIPEEVGYSLSYDLGVGEIIENGNEIATFLGKNSDFDSENYESAEKKITIVARVGVGSLEINNI